MANATHHFLASSFLPSDPNWTWRKTEARFARAGYGVRQSAVPNKLSTPFEGTADVVFKTLTFPCAIVNLIFFPLCAALWKQAQPKLGGRAANFYSINHASFPKEMARKSASRPPEVTKWEALRHAEGALHGSQVAIWADKELTSEHASEARSAAWDLWAILAESWKSLGRVLLSFAFFSRLACNLLQVFAAQVTWLFWCNFIRWPNIYWQETMSCLVENCCKIPCGLEPMLKSCTADTRHAEQHFNEIYIQPLCTAVMKIQIRLSFFTCDMRVLDQCKLSVLLGPEHLYESSPCT